MVTNEMLAATLEQMGVHFLAKLTSDSIEDVVSPADLLSGLASSRESRTRLALIPLFLQHPQHAIHAIKALSNLSSAQQHLLQCYYTAAQLLQEKYHGELESFFCGCVPLPALFEESLGLDSNESADTRLHQLAAQQSDLSGKPLNWYGTYEHAYKRLIRGEKQRRRWRYSQVRGSKSSC